MTLGEHPPLPDGFGRLYEFPADLFVDDDGVSLYGRCGHCKRVVDNLDENHRVTAIVRGGRGVECVLRGDIEAVQAGPLRKPEAL